MTSTRASTVDRDVLATLMAREVDRFVDEDAIWVGDELRRRFGLPFWQFTLSATDANRFALRLCREVTGRSKVLVFDHCYHGSVDETFATVDAGGAVGPSHGSIGPAVNP